MKRKIRIFFLILLFISITLTAFAVSSSVKSSQDYRYTLNIIRKLEIIIENFPDEKRTADFAKIKNLFQSASEDYYGRNFVDAQRKFMKLKDDIRLICISISQFYLNRAKSILDSTAKKSFDTLITFNKNSALKTYFKKPFRPLKYKKHYPDEYSEKDYHFFYDNETIERYLKEGYRAYHSAKRYYEDPEVAILNNKRRRTSYSLNYLINLYINIVKLCRLSKQYGIEIYKIRGVHSLPDISKKYGLGTAALEPIYDDRIPQDYKVDAIDNLNLLYSIELLKIGGGIKKPQSK